MAGRARRHAGRILRGRLPRELSRRRIFCAPMATPPASWACGCFPIPLSTPRREARWDAQRFYDDPSYYRDPKLVRPYRVGMACGFCHVAPASAASAGRSGASGLAESVEQYRQPVSQAGAVFVLPGNEDNFLFQVVNAMPPGTIDTSALATDNLNNPRNMNAIYDVGTRIAIAAHEKLAGGNLDMPGTKPDMPVPHVLKDGADSIGIKGALARVYISIGTYHEEWIKHFNLLVGGKKQTPIRSPRRVKTRRISAPRSTAWRMSRSSSSRRPSRSHWRARRAARNISRTIRRRSRAAQQVFAENCASCHVSPNKMPPPPPGVARYSKQWCDWTRSDDFKREMTALVRAPDFLQDNYLATDQPYLDGMIGTNACAAVASNALRGHIWDNFSSETYKQRAAGRHHRRARSVHGADATLHDAGRRARLSARALADQHLGLGALSAQQFGGRVHRRPVGGGAHEGVRGRHGKTAVAGKAARGRLDRSAPRRRAGSISTSPICRSSCSWR